MLKEYVKKQGRSVYRIAKDSGVAYTTLNELVLGKKNPQDCSIKTVFSLARYFGISIDEMYKIIQGKGETKKMMIASNWEDAKKKKYAFPIIEDSNSYDAFRIHPLKQRVVKSIYDSLAFDARIESLILFGSATNIRCNKDSDVDIAITLKSVSNDVKNEISEIIGELTGYNSDILWMDKISKGSQIERNIKRGVKII